MDSIEMHANNCYLRTLAIFERIFWYIHCNLFFILKIPFSCNKTLIKKFY